MPFFRRYFADVLGKVPLVPFRVLGLFEDGGACLPDLYEQRSRYV